MVTTPAEIPETTPVLLTVAFAVSLLLQVPPEVESVRVIAEPAVRDVAPEIALTKGGSLPLT